MFDLTSRALANAKKVEMKIKNKKLFTSMRENTIAACKFYLHQASKSPFLPKLSRFTNKRLYSVGLGSALNRYNNSFTLYSAFADKKLYSDYRVNEKFLNFGSGAFFHSRWKNYDYPGQSLYYQNVQGKEGKDFFAIDLCEEKLKIPEDNDSVSLIYCSHTLEHLDKVSSLRFLTECFRILKKDGVMRVALPNTKNDFYLMRCLQAQSGANKDIKRNYFLDAASEILSDAGKLDFDDLLELLDKSQYESHLFYNNVIEKYPEKAIFSGKDPERHINYWDFDHLIDVVTNIGFTCAIPTFQGSSIASPFTNLHVFDTTEPHISFYADIVK